MTPDKRRRATRATPATEASTEPASAAPSDGTQLVGPGGDPVGQEASTGSAGGDSGPPADTTQVAPLDRATKQWLEPHRALHPERVWPD